MSERTKPVVVEQAYNVSAVELWNAITQRDQMVEWFFEEITEFRPEAGFATSFNVNTGERDFKHLWQIIDVVPGEKIVYDWRYENMEGIGTVTFEVERQGEGSRLRVTNEGVETFVEDIPEFKRESCEKGWKYFVQDSLKSYLEN